MSQILIECPWIEQSIVLESDKKVQISIVAYEHIEGIPARFCAGLFPAVALLRQLESNAMESVVRLIDPTPIANYCNGWKGGQSRFRAVAADFLDDHKVSFFFDEAEKVDGNVLEILSSLGAILESSADADVANVVARIRESGRKHGGELGAHNTLLYMAAHPFSWLDMYHPLIWKREYLSEDTQFINLMSKSENRFSVIRKFLQEQVPQMCTTINPINRYMTVCDTPCYIPLVEEPLFIDLVDKGYDWCHRRYKEIKKISNSHRRALKDFERLMSFLGLKSV